MSVAVLDTNIIIDILRQNESALTWLSQQHEALLITPMTWMETLEGVRKKQHQQPTINVLSQFRMVYPTKQDLDWAMVQQNRLRPSYAIDLMDYLIASVCFRLAIPILTHNRKHMCPLLGDDFVIKPYNS